MPVGRDYRYVNWKRLTIYQFQENIDYPQLEENVDLSNGRDYRFVNSKRLSIIVH
jgi:hypothetical protein